MTLDDLVGKRVVDERGQRRGRVVEVALTAEDPPAVAALLTGAGGMLHRLGIPWPAWLRRRPPREGRFAWSTVMDVGEREVVVRDAL